jgi:hypothetical protein
VRSNGAGGGLRRLLNLISLGLLVTAVIKELRKPADQRTWNGTVAGFVPYDLRVPTLARVQERIWNPDDETVVNPAVFGVGWTLNLGRIWALVRARADERA